MAKKFYVTTPIYYVNAQPHIGHTYTTLAADILARYHRLIGDKVFFSTGTDEHGAKIEEKARLAGKAPKAFADEVSADFQRNWEAMGFSHDRFIRTTEAAHMQAVGDALLYMKQKGDIYLGKYEGLYCRGCEQFKAEKDLVNGLCPDHQTPPEKVSEETYMFRLSKYRDELKAKILSDELRIRPVERKNEVLSFLDEGLADISFSRKNVSWGVPLPWRSGHTAYVWADAFLNYLTVLDWDPPTDPLSKAVRSWPKVDEFWPPDVQLMSKDILRVHATIWPAMLLSLDMPLQRQIFVHGFFLIDGQKMSKSLGNVISPQELKDKYGADGARYLLMSSTSFGHDGDIGWTWLSEKYNADLANGLGNIAARLTTLTAKIRESGGELVKAPEFLDLKARAALYARELGEIKLDAGLALVWDAIRLMDKHITEHEPWKLIARDKISAGGLLYSYLETLRILGFFLWPYMPATAEKIWQRLGLDPALLLKGGFSAGIEWGQLAPGSKVEKGEALFPRI